VSSALPLASGEPSASVRSVSAQGVQTGSAFASSCCAKPAPQTQLPPPPTCAFPSAHDDSCARRRGCGDSVGAAAAAAAAAACTATTRGAETGAAAADHGCTSAAAAARARRTGSLGGAGAIPQISRIWAYRPVNGRGSVERRPDSAPQSPAALQTAIYQHQRGGILLLLFVLCPPTPRLSDRGVCRCWQPAVLQINT